VQRDLSNVRVARVQIRLLAVGKVLDLIFTVEGHVADELTRDGMRASIPKLLPVDEYFGIDPHWPVPTVYILCNEIGRNSLHTLKAGFIKRLGQHGKKVFDP
jgi:hypothetical protein